MGNFTAFLLVILAACAAITYAQKTGDIGCYQNNVSQLEGVK